MTEVILSIAGLVLSVALYFAGVKRGERQEREKQALEALRDKGLREHELQIERDRRQHEMLSKIADEYVDMARRHFANGVHALERLGLDVLGSDRLIRDAIEQMRTRTGKDPWSGQSQHVEGVHLARFY